MICPQIGKLYEEGLTQSEIGGLFGLSQSRVSEVLGISETDKTNIPRILRVTGGSKNV